MKTLALASSSYEPIFLVDRLIGRSTLHRLRHVLLLGKIISFGIAIVLQLLDLGGYSAIAYGIGVLCMALWWEQVLLMGYHNHYYFMGLSSILSQNDQPSESIVTYEVARTVTQNPTDLTAAFCQSPLGSCVLRRSGVSEAAQKSYLDTFRPCLTAETIILPEGDVYTLIDLGLHLLQYDTSFQDFLQNQGVLEAHYRAALQWVIGDYHRAKQITRWWGKDRLSQTTPIGRDWTHGTAFLLERFSRSINTSAVFSTLTNNAPFAAEKLVEIETALQRPQSANVLIIGEAGVGTMDLVVELDRRIKKGTALKAIENQHIIILDTNRLFAACPNGEKLEQTLLQLFDEAIVAGDIIIVIENISGVIAAAAEKGVSFPELIDEYLASPLLHVIATDTPGTFHTHLEPLQGLRRRFSEILIDELDLSATTRLLQTIATSKEQQFPVFFTYAGLHAITLASDRYLVQGVMPDKAIGFLEEVIVKAAARKIEIITEDIVYQLISEKTGVPAGPISTAERDALLHLENTLQTKVVGQKEALRAIARTMRRARAGIQSGDKPIGSFLFLGPTGVGKTETAKALASVFFGSETNLQRLDMSEFSGSDASLRLLGDQEHSGLLSDLLREQPYGVLLLDEFEKAHRTVHDLFLQILDEGIFTDGRGTKVNARNAIIIATSNAGSQLILKTVKQRESLSHLTAHIIDSVISDGLFRPELINRFDSVIIFEPLKQDGQLQITHLQLQELYDRIKARGYAVTLAPELISALAQKGYSPEFGARPLKRILQDLVEEKVAQKIISGEAVKGTTITLTVADFSEGELTA